MVSDVCTMDICNLLKSLSCIFSCCLLQESRINHIFSSESYLSSYDTGSIISTLESCVDDNIEVLPLFEKCLSCILSLFSSEFCENWIIRPITHRITRIRCGLCMTHIPYFRPIWSPLIYIRIRREK